MFGHLLLILVNDKPAGTTAILNNLLMKRFWMLGCFALCLVKASGYAQTYPQKALAKTILNNADFDTVQNRAIRLLSGFSAGTSYNEVWIRDFNTFIKGSLKAHPKEEVKAMLLMFFKNSRR